MDSGDPRVAELQTICFPDIVRPNSGYGAGFDYRHGLLCRRNWRRAGEFSRGACVPIERKQSAMPRQESIRLRFMNRQSGEPADRRAVPIAVILALNCGEGAQPGSEGGEQSWAAPQDAAPQEQAAAIFSSDESSPVAAFFVAETAFDCEDGDATGTGDWLSCED